MLQELDRLVRDLFTYFHYSCSARNSLSGFYHSKDKGTTGEKASSKATPHTSTPY